MPTIAVLRSEPDIAGRPAGFRPMGAGPVAASRVVVSGELDIATVGAFDDALRQAEADAALVVLDLRELDFVDCSSAALMLAAHRRISEAGGRLGVVRGPPQIDWYFELIGLDRELELVDRPPAAVGTPAVWTGVARTTPADTVLPIVAVHGRIDGPAVAALERRIGSALDAGHRTLLVDLSAVTRLGGSSLSAFGGSLRRVSRDGTRLLIAGADPAVRRVLEVCAIDGVALCPTLAAAVTAGGQAGWPREMTWGQPALTA